MKMKMKRGYQGRNEVCGIRDQKSGFRKHSGEIRVYSPGIWSHKPWDRDQ